jgi:sugar phosphate isomerase/epimerase
MYDVALPTQFNSSPPARVSPFRQNVSTEIPPPSGGVVNISWKKYMKVGLVHFMAFPETLKGEGPILETFEKILSDDFFDVIEITTIKDSAVRQKAKAMLETSKITVTYGSQPVQLVNKLNLNSFEAAERSQALDRCKACIDEAIEMGAVGVSFLSGPDPGPERRKEAMELFFDSLNQLCTHAARQSDIKVVVETFDYDIDKKALVGPNAEAAALSARLREKHKNFGLMLDLSHIPLQHETIDSALTAAKDHLVHAHMGNCVMRDKNHPAYGDQHPRFGVPGGENDVPQVVEYIRKLIGIGYLTENQPRILSFEVKPTTGELSAVVLANAKRTLREAWDLL